MMPDFTAERAAFRRRSQEKMCIFTGGISSVVYFASKIPTSWQDAKLLSAHGKQVNLLNSVQRYPKIIMIVSGAGRMSCTFARSCMRQRWIRCE